MNQTKNDFVEAMRMIQRAFRRKKESELDLTKFAGLPVPASADNINTNTTGENRNAESIPQPGYQETDGLAEHGRTCFAG